MMENIIRAGPSFILPANRSLALSLKFVESLGSPPLGELAPKATERAVGIIKLAQIS